MRLSKDRLVDEHTASKITGIKIGTLRKWRRQGRGPVVKCVEGRLVRYSLREIQKWVQCLPCLNGIDPLSGSTTSEGEQR